MHLCLICILYVKILDLPRQMHTTYYLYSAAYKHQRVRLSYFSISSQTQMSLSQFLHSLRCFSDYAFFGWTRYSPRPLPSSFSARLRFLVSQICVFLVPTPLHLSRGHPHRFHGNSRRPETHAFRCFGIKGHYQSPMNRTVRYTEVSLGCHGMMRVQKDQNEPSVLAQRACSSALEWPSPWND